MTFARVTLLTGVALVLAGCPEDSNTPATDGGADLGDAARPTDGGQLVDRDPPDAGQPPDQGEICTPAVERCNGLDDDCDGSIDEDHPTVGAPCSAGEGTCAADGVYVCGPAGDVVCDAAVGQPRDEQCDGADDDCDGAIDEAFGVGLACEAGIGACRAVGRIECGEGGLARCSAEAAAPAAEQCNGEDDDCDGRTDERLDGRACGTGQSGACDVGVLACDGGAARCDAAVEAVDEICDGIDNDCDGETDEGGICAEICDNGADEDGDGAFDCDDLDCEQHVACRPPVEICNNAVDDDGDEAVDCDDDDCAQDPFCVFEICDNGVDDDDNDAVDCADAECADDQRCQPEICDNGVDDELDGAVDCDDDECADFPACRVEICDNGQDDDGDEATDCADEDCAADAACQEVCEGGVDEDLDGATDCADEDCAAHPACQEVCEGGVDEDLDGATDCADDDCADDPACQEVCAGGVDEDLDGAIDCDDPDCEGDVACPVEVCDNGQDDDGDSATDCADDDCAGHPACRELCAGGVDEDLDGDVDCADADCVGAPECVEVCDNGADDDLDGAVDCDDDDCRDDRACGRNVVLVCGNVQQELSVLFPPSDGISLGSGCDPDARTRALLVTRSAVNQALIDGDGWRAWVEGGGRLLTEYSNSDEIVTALFGEAAVEGAHTGQCENNVNPVVRHNEDDPFWQINGRLPLQPIETSGCGRDLSGYAEAVPLGGWDAATVSLAYRPLGEGRVWLVETDWQDSEVGGSYFNASTRRLMRSMVLDPFDARCGEDADCGFDLRCFDGGCVRLPSEDCTNGLDDDLDGLADCLDSACGLHPECVPRCDADQIRVAFIGGGFYHDDAQVELDRRTGDIVAERIDACDLDTLLGYDVIVLNGNPTCADPVATTAFVESGGGVVGVPWVANQGDRATLPVDAERVVESVVGPVSVRIIDPDDPLVEGWQFRALDGQCDEGNPPISDDPDCVGYAGHQALDGAFVSAMLDAGVPSAVWWRFGEGRAVYLAYHYVTSDTYSAAPHDWGIRLLENAVRVAAGCLTPAVLDR